MMSASATQGGHKKPDGNRCSEYLHHTTLAASRCVNPIPNPIAFLNLVYSSQVLIIPKFHEGSPITSLVILFTSRRTEKPKTVHAATSCKGTKKLKMQEKNSRVSN